MPDIIVRELDVMTEAQWSFRDSKPTWRHGRHGSVGSFDPFPAYPHDLAVVEEAAQAVAEKCPPWWNVELYVANREEEGRSNGYSHVTQDGHHDEGDRWVKDSPVGLVVLSGKRIPPHPSVTRYLVAHEYGHNVEWMINVARGRGLHSDDTVQEYAALRGMADLTHHGSGGRWHNSAHEVFACDFRIIVCGEQPDYWPHPGVPHPLDRSLPHDLHSWWAQALADLTEAAETKVSA